MLAKRLAHALRDLQTNPDAHSLPEPPRSHTGIKRKTFNDELLSRIALLNVNLLVTPFSLLVDMTY